MGLNVTGNPITVLVGVPSSTVRISTFTGAFPESLLAKNKSTAVKNAPFTSSNDDVGEGASIFPATTNDCARGSTNLYRDENSGAIVNCDSVSYNQYLNTIHNRESQRKELDQIKQDINEIKTLLRELINEPR